MKSLAALPQLGMDLDLESAGRTFTSENVQGRHQPRTSNVEPFHPAGASPETKRPSNLAVEDSAADERRLDHFVQRDGMRFAGTHLIVDLWDASRIDDLAHVDATLRAATEAAGATLLNIDLHHFSPNNGVSGVAVLAESHISIHTWPECGYAAIDIFMCGDARPHQAIEVLRAAFRPSNVSVAEHKRGIVA